MPEFFHRKKCTVTKQESSEGMNASLGRYDFWGRVGNQHELRLVDYYPNNPSKLFAQGWYSVS